jgi:PAS domain S-box-containing protein
MIGRSKEQLSDELKELRDRVGELEEAEKELKRLKGELDESQEKCRVLLGLINSASNPMALYSTKGILLLMNAAAAKNLEGRPDEFVGKSIYEIHPETIADMEMDKIRKVVDSGEGSEFEGEFELPSGKRWFRYNFLPMKDASGDIFAVQVISYDITEVKQAQSAQPKREAKAEAPKATGADVIFAYDREGRYRYINRVGPKALGRKRTDIVGKKLAELFPEEKAKPLLEDIGRVFRENRILQVEQVIPAYEENRYFSTTLSPIHNDDGDVVLVMGIAHDITGEKRGEQKRMAGLEIAADMMASMLDGNGIAMKEDETPTKGK